MRRGKSQEEGRTQPDVNKGNGGSVWPKLAPSGDPEISDMRPVFMESLNRLVGPVNDWEGQKRRQVG